MSEKDKTIVPMDEQPDDPPEGMSANRTAPTMAGTIEELTAAPMSQPIPEAETEPDANSLEDRIRTSIEGTSARVRVDPLIGKLIADRFEILTKIGTGGMGTVYKARQRGMDRFVAVKVLLRQYVTNETVVKRFQREALAVSKLEHPNTVRIYDFGQTEDGTFYLAMEYLSGSSLSHRIRHERQLSVRQSLHLVRQIALSLNEAHAKGIVHRDLKPDNIFVGSVDGSSQFAKVLDFGVAKLREVQEDSGTLTQHGTIFGTPKYMSPEQCRCEGVDGRSDLYSLGIILYELLSGRVPFDSDNPLAILIMHAQESVRPLNEVRPDLVIPFDVEELLHRLMAKKASERPESANALVQEIDRVMQKLPNEFDGVLTYEEAEEAGMTYERSQAFTVPDSEKAMPGMGESMSDPRSNKTIAVTNLPPVKRRKRSKKRLFMAAVILSMVVTGSVLYANLKPLPTSTTALFPDALQAETDKASLPDIQADLVTVTMRANVGNVTIINHATGKVLPQRIDVANKPVVFRWLREDRKHTIRLERAGSEPILREVDLNKDNDLALAVFTVTDTKSAAVTVRANVGGARVSIVGSDQLFAMPTKPSESRVISVPISDEAVLIRMEKSGYTTQDLSFTPSKDGQLVFNLTADPSEDVVATTIRLEVQMNVGRVDVEIEQTGATYRTPKRGQDPLAITMLRGDDTQKLLFKKRGYVTESRVITPNADQTVTVKLKRKAGTPSVAPDPAPNPIKVSPIKKTPKPAPGRIKLTPIK